MAKSMVEKYEQILSADPGSMVFVELAKALIDKGDNGRAIDVVARGLDHHPDSIVGRVLWGKALLNLGKPVDAMEQFDQAVAIEKDNPYAYNLIGEVLLHKQLYRSALPILKKAVQLQPGDGRVRQWLEQAQRALGGGPVQEQRDHTTVDATAEGAPAGGAAAAGPASFDDTHPDPPGGPVWPGADRPAEPIGDSTLVDAKPAAAPAPAPAAEDPFEAATRRAGPADDEVMPGLTSTFLTLAAREGAGAPAAGPIAPLEVPPSALAAGPSSAAVRPGFEGKTEPLSPYKDPPGSRPAFDGGAKTDPLPALGGDPQASVRTLPLPPGVDPDARTEPLPPKPKPPPIKGKPSALDLLGDIPDVPAPAPAARVETAPPEQQRVAAQQAAAIAAEYEKELRQRLYTEQARPKSFLRRHWLAVSLSVVTVVALAASGVAYLWVRAQTREKDIADYTAKARNGLTRDTLAAYRASLEALAKVLDRDDENAPAKALRAQALATLAAVYGEAGADEAKQLLDLPAVRAAEPEAVLAARWTLAGLTPEPAARKAIEDEILGVKVEDAGPTLHSLAGAVLLERNQPSQAIDRFNAAIKEMPSHVPTLVRVGDYFRSRDDHENSLKYYGLALAVAEDHPGALLGAAESRLASSKDPKLLEGSLAALAQLGAGEAVPVGARPQLSLLRARLHAALGQRAQALEVLSANDAAIKARLDLVATLAEAYLQAGALDRAQDALEVAVKARPGDTVLEAQLAQVLLARERFADVVGMKAGPEERALHLLKGIAYYRLNDLARARFELRSTASKPEGRLPADAVVYLSLVDLASGDKETARANLQRLGTGPRARTAGRWAYSELLASEGNLDEAEKLLREAVEADPRYPETRCALGRLLLERGQLEPAIAELTEAAGLNPFHREALVALGHAHLAKGEHDAARGRFEAARALEAKDGGALAGLALVLRAEGKTKEAREEAQKAVKAAPKAPATHRALAEISLSAGDPGAASRAFKQARKLAPADASLAVAHGEAQLAAADGRGALSSFEAALAQSPGLLRARLGKARALIATKKPIPAEKELKALLKELKADKKNGARARAYLSEALLAQGKAFVPKAVREAKKAAKLDEGSAAAQLALARALELAADNAGAAAAYTRAAELGPKEPEIHLSRGFFLAATGEDPAAASDALKRYLELAPKGPSAAAAKKVLAQLK